MEERGYHLDVPQTLESWALGEFLMLHYEIQGTGNPMVLLHAFPVHSELWRDDIRIFSKHAQVITPDLPGFGKSELIDNGTMEKMAEEVIHLLDYLGIKERVILCGLSMGGYVAFEVLRRYTSRIGALGLFSTRASADTPEGRENRFKTIEKIKTDGMDGFVSTQAEKLLGASTCAAFPEIIKQVEKMIRSHSSEAIIQALRAMAYRADSQDLLSQIQVPTLILAGDEDKVLPLDESRKMQQKIRGAHLHILKGSGHLINLEKASEFQRLVTHFIQSL